MVTQVWVLTYLGQVIATFVDPHAIEDWFHDNGFGEIRWEDDPNDYQMVEFYDDEDRMYTVTQSEVFN